MPLRRKAKQPPHLDEVASAPYDPVWGVPPVFNAVHDIVDVAQRDHTTTALVHVSADGTIDVSTFRDVARDSARWSRLLLANAVAPGDRVLVGLEPGSSWVAVVLGAMRIGALPAPIGAGYDLDDLVVRAELVEPSALVVDRPGVEAGAEGSARLPPDMRVLAVNELHARLVQPGSPTPLRETAADAPALIAFTRGRSSGAPRPVLHSHAAAFAAGRTLREWLQVEARDIVWCDVPGSSATALWAGLFGPWQLGATVLTVDSAVSDDEKVTALERFAPSVVVHTPARSAELLDLLDRTGSRLTCLRHASSTDDALDAALAARFAATTGVRLANGFSTTETGILVFQAQTAAEAVGSIGTPVDGVIVSPVDVEGYVSPDGVVGDLALYGRPASLCLGYWDGAVPTGPAAGGEWWTLIGDRASFDQSGRLWLEPTGAAPTGAQYERAAAVDEPVTARPTRS